MNHQAFMEYYGDKGFDGLIGSLVLLGVLVGSIKLLVHYLRTPR